MKGKLCSRYWLSIIFVVVATMILFSIHIGLDEQLCGCELPGTTTARVLNGTAVDKNALRWVASLFIRYQDLSADKG